MAIKWQQIDDYILGMAFGFVLVTPQIIIWLAPKLASILPSSFFIFDSWSVPIFGAIAGLILGAFVKYTK